MEFPLPLICQVKPRMMPQSPLDANARTKTVATIGPACSDHDMLVEMIRAGVDVFRINMAHGDRESHQACVDAIRNASLAAKLPVATLADLAGPKIRLGTLPQDPLQCANGQQLTFVRGEESEDPSQLVTNYAKLLDELDVGDTVMLTDGTVRLEVIETGDGFAHCKVVDGGTIRSRQGVNLPGVKLSVPAMDETDIDNARWAGREGIDFISLSFVRTPEEINELKAMLHDQRSKAQVIAKIEKREAMENLEAIVEAANGVMVARGDLGVEIDIAQTALAQKKIIHVCRQQGKPVIVATQMLESMHRSARPTRAEVSDVSNAILDGADACMLSGETAIGEYPLAAVKMMQRIMIETERVLHRRPSRTDSLRNPEHDESTAVVFGASQVAKQIDARLLVLATGSTSVLLAKSKQRDFIPTICVTESTVTQRRACMFWGIYPLLADKVDDTDAVAQAVRRWLHDDPHLKPNDLMVLVASHGTVGHGLDTIVLDRVNPAHRQ